MKAGEENSQDESHREAPLFDEVFHTIPEGVAVIDQAYTVRRANANYAGIVKPPPAGAAGKKCYKLLRNLDSPCPECPLTNSQYSEGYMWSLEGAKYQISVNPLSSGAGGFVETLINVSRYEAAQAKLRRSERLASLGTLVTGVAHELNNPLSGISGNSQLMLRSPEKYGLNDKGLERVRTIYQSVERATIIVNDLLYLSKPSEGSLKKMDLANLLQESLDQVSGIRYPDIAVNFQLPETKIKVWGQREPLMNVFTKLLANACHSIQDKKTHYPGFEGKISIKGEVKDKRILLEINDNGMGVPAENLPHVFDPFFTTKDPGSGTGLGLSLCHRIMSEHNGSINLTNTNPGVKVQLVFPTQKPMYT